MLPVLYSGFMIEDALYRRSSTPMLESISLIRAVVTADFLCLISNYYDFIIILAFIIKPICSIFSDSIILF